MNLLSRSSWRVALPAAAVALTVACGEGADSTVASSAAATATRTMAVLAPIDPHLKNPRAITVDSTGTLWIVDDRVVRTISPAGVVKTIAGGLIVGTAIAVDANGRAYVTDAGGNNIKMFEASGWSGALWFDTTGTTYGLSMPSGIAIDAQGNILIGDSANNAVKRLPWDALSYTSLQTVAGQLGVPPGFADGDALTEALFNVPRGVAVNAAGVILATDSNNAAVRKIANGQVTTVASSYYEMGGLWGAAVDGAGNFYVGNDRPGAIFKFAPDGQWIATIPTADGWRAIASDAAGTLFAADPNERTIRKITQAPNGATFEVVAGVPGRDGTDDGVVRHIAQPRGVAVDSKGNTWVADSLFHVVTRVSSTGAVTTFGTPYRSGSTDGTASTALFSAPSAVAIDGADNVYVVDAGSRTIRRITAAGVVSTFAGTAGGYGIVNGNGPSACFNAPYGIAASPGGTLYVTENYDGLVRRITPARDVSTMPGSFSAPTGVAVSGDRSPIVYVAESGTHSIKALSARGVVTTFAGTGVAGRADGPAASASFTSPELLFLDTSGNLYVSDTGNCTVRKVSKGIVSTVAGIAGNCANVPGTLPTSMAAPHGVAYDAFAKKIIAANDAGLMRISP